MRCRLGAYRRLYATVFSRLLLNYFSDNLRPLIRETTAKDEKQREETENHCLWHATVNYNLDFHLPLHTIIICESASTKLQTEDIEER